MSVPDYQSLMLPLLKLASDDKEHTLAEAIDVLGAQFKLTEEEKRELLPSGRHAKFENRVGWARTYLKKAGLLESTGRGKFRITQRGLEVLKSKPQRIDVKYLSQFPEFIEFRTIVPTDEEPRHEEPKTSQTPEEVLEASYQALRKTTAQELLDRVKQCSPRFFEKLVVDLLVSMGYGGTRKDAGEAVGQSGDGGIDGIIKEDKLGLDAVYIQAKRWEGAVGSPVVRAFAGSLEGQRARKGVLITTSHFSQDAKEFVSKIEKKIVLIDGARLVELMIDHSIGVIEAANYKVCRIETDYFTEED